MALPGAGAADPAFEKLLPPMKKSLLSPRKILPALLFLAGSTIAQPIHFDSPDGYQSPYSFHFTIPEADRARGWDAAPWSTPERWSIIPRGDWYNRRAYRNRGFENLAYGARPVHFPPSGGGTSEWKRERVLTVAQRLVGMHLPAPPHSRFRSVPDASRVAVAACAQRHPRRGDGLQQLRLVGLQLRAGHSPER
jgi:hypothetical protein